MKKLILLIGLAILVVFSCREAIPLENLKITTSISAPLVQGGEGASSVINDALGDNSSLSPKIDPATGNYYFVTESDTISYSANALLDKANITFEGMSARLPGGSPPLPLTYSDTVAILPANSSYSVDSLAFQSGSLDFNFGSPYSSTITVKIPSITKNGIAVGFDNSTTTNPTIDLQGATMKTFEDTNIILQITLASAMPNQIKITPTNLKISEFYGNIGEIDIKPSDSIIYELVKREDITVNELFGKGTLALYLENKNIGVPVSAYLFQEVIGNNIDKDSFSIELPTAVKGQTEPSTQKIPDTVNMHEDTLLLYMRGTVNKDHTANDNFIISDGFIKVVPEIRVEEIKFTGLRINDTSPQDFSNIVDQEGYASLSINILNSFPFEVDTFEVLLLGAMGDIISTIVPPQKIEASQTTKQTIDGSVTNAELKKTKSIFIKIVANTANEQFIQLSPNDTIYYQIGASISSTVNL